VLPCVCFDYVNKEDEEKIVIAFRQLYEKDPITRTIAVAKEFSDYYFNDGSLQLDVPSSMIRSTWNVKYIVVSQVTSFFCFFVFYMKIKNTF
jgi:hypothetical protein